MTVPGFTATATTIKDGAGTDRRPAIPLGWSTPLPGVTGVRFQIRVLGRTPSRSRAVPPMSTQAIMWSPRASSPMWPTRRAPGSSGRRRRNGPHGSRHSPDVQFTSDDIAGGVAQLLADAGMSAVEIVTALPTTGNFAGRVVYLTTDQKLYRWTGTVWTAAVPTVDLVGQIVADQVANGAITTAKFAAGIAPVEIVASCPPPATSRAGQSFLTTDSKTYRIPGRPLAAPGSPPPCPPST